MLVLKSLLLVLLGAEYSHCARSIVDVFNLEVDYSKWNSDLAPVIANLSKRMRREFLPIAQEILYDDEIPAECLQSFLRLASGLSDGKMWALRFLDSSGGLLPGSLKGRVASLGSYDQCLETRVPDKEDPKKVAFGGQYCTASMVLRKQPLLHRILPSLLRQDPETRDLFGKGNLSYMTDILENIPIGYRVGICLPSTCNSSVITHLVDKFGGEYGVHADILGCRDQITERPLSIGTRISGVVFGCMIFLVVVGTTVDIYCGDDQRGVIQVARCFSARANYLKLTSTRVAPESRHVDCIHGIRVVSAIWILYGHSFLKELGLWEGLKFLLLVPQSPAGTIITQGFFAVETFFTLTGFTLYKFIAQERKTNKMSAPMFASMAVLRRGIRLGVTGMGALMTIYLMPLITSGPALDYLYPYIEKNCNSRWWTYPLFINNFWSMEEACAENQWYTAADMQIVCILIFPVLLMVQKPAKAIRILVCLIGASILYTLGLMSYYGAAPVLLVLPTHASATLHYVLHMHHHGLPHLSSTCVGVLGGYVIENYRDVDLGKTFYRIGWILFNFISISLVGVSYLWHMRRSVSTLESFLYAALCRPLWAACVIWLVYMCSSGRARSIRWLLSRPNFTVLSRLSLSFYLMQYPMFMFSFLTARNQTTTTYYQVFREFFADFIIIILAAWMLVLLFEAPAAALDSLVTRRPRKKALPNGKGDEKLSYETPTRLEVVSQSQYKL
ncbi:O-acyltransferase like protein [Galendromus occidentalis]|uniref:O-acyltransferase like protein n=1 Tax=Galendromus occidentalis TaxID=34638 RepID=A0AAJ6QPT8_9ACAR|nr:O-acyltransferase like protein [Galendromus occidentalis]